MDIQWFMCPIALCDSGLIMTWIRVVVLFYYSQVQFSHPSGDTVVIAVFHVSEMEEASCGAGHPGNDEEMVEPSCDVWDDPEVDTERQQDEGQEILWEETQSTTSNQCEERGATPQTHVQPHTGQMVALVDTGAVFREHNYSKTAGVQARQADGHDATDTSGTAPVEEGSLHKTKKPHNSGFSSLVKTGLNKHKTKRTKRFVCGECGYRTVSMSYLNKHIKKHPAKKPYKCKKCDFSSARKRCLATHMLRHTGEKPFMCGECGHRTVTKSDLAKHMRTHTGEKPHKCDQCDFASACKDRLRRHMFKHGGEKPFQCGECGYRAIDRFDLSMHMKRHTDGKSFKCDQCDFSSAWKRSLARHMLVHTENKPYMCGECEYKTTVKNYLTKHMKKHTERQFSPTHVTTTLVPSAAKKP
uniref:C2H2-type domain-containing protein n=1 Tax=Branchiostoma floridae TaxID=7739 RepID=C3YU35_BRAFL|eukprot:XP_002600300.1 hypothetical protein BRAFLDRAFT_66801 [Branchiostoma floridae]